MGEELELLDWKRRVFELYAEVRAADDPERAGVAGAPSGTSCSATIPSRPRPAIPGSTYFPYDPELRVLAAVEPVEEELREIAGSAGSLTTFRRFGRVSLPVGTLDVYWLEAYGGGVFVPFADGTSGHETYGGGRYLLDTVKGSDLGGEDGRLVLDFNFAYNPSCAYDGRWACPLAPPANRLGAQIRAGERTPS